MDSGSFGTVWYMQAADSGDLTDLFTVDRATGLISLNGTFSSAAGSRTTILSLIACDNLGGEPLLCSDVLSVSVYFIGDEHLVVLTFAAPIDEVEASLDEIQEYVSQLVLR